MAETQSQTDINTPADNIVPFPAASATANDGKDTLYTADDLKKTFTPGAATNRTVRDLVAKVREAYYWLDEVEFKRGDNFTQFCFDQIKVMKESGLTQKQWIAEIQKQKPVEVVEEIQESAEMILYNPGLNPEPVFGALAIATKATQKREILKGELIQQEDANDSSWLEFSTLMDDLQTESQAATEDDELEFQLLRKRNAAKWLKRKAILEQDKLLILQGEISPKSPSGNGSNISS